MGAPYSDGSVGRARLHGKNRLAGVGIRGLTVSRTTQRLPSPASSLGAVGSSSACTAAESPTNSCRLIATAFFFCPLPCARTCTGCDGAHASAVRLRLQHAAWPGRGRRASESYVRRWGVCGLEAVGWLWVESGCRAYHGSLRRAWILGVHFCCAPAGLSALPRSASPARLQRSRGDAARAARCVRSVRMRGAHCLAPRYQR